DPVELAAGSPTVTAAPPEYARATVETQTVSGPADVSVLQHGSLTFELKFTRPAVAARLEWSTTAANGKDKVVEKADLELTDGGRAAKLTRAARLSGSY